MPPTTSIDHLLTDRATIKRNQETKVGPGRFQNNYVAIATAVRFRVFTASAKDINYGQQLRMDVTHTAYTLPEQDVNTGDQIELILKEGSPVSGISYMVVGVMDPSLVHHRKLLLVRVVTATP